MSKFVISITSLTSKQEEEFVKYLTDNGAGYWHRTNDFWLVNSNSTDVTKETIRAELQKNFNGTMIVIDVTNSSDWAGFGVTKDFDWMKNNWDINDEIPG